MFALSVAERTDPIKANHFLKNFKIPRLDLTTFNVAPLLALVTIYSSVIPCNSLGANGTFGSIRDRTRIRGNITTYKETSLLKTAIRICVMVNPYL